MKKVIMALSFLILVISSCSNQPVDLSDPLNSGRGFIEASLKGDYTRAEKYLLVDSTNMQYLEGLKDFNKKSDKIERENYREANIIVDSLITISDSENILYYHNSYKKEPSRLKVVKENDKWLVDFKYSFNEN